MLVVSNYYQPITILHPKTKRSVTFYQGVITDVDNSFLDLPAFKSRVERGILVVSGVEEAKKEIDKKVNIPDDMKRELNKYCVPYSENTDESVLLEQLAVHKERYSELFEELSAKGIKVTKRMNLDTLKELAKGGEE